MKRFESQVCLLENDIIDDFEERNNISFNDSQSSGYESGDSASSSPPSPSPKTRTLSTPSCETMVYSNTDSLCDSLQLILSMPDMCDVTFLVGEGQHPVHGIKAVMATRSRVFYEMILHHQRRKDEEAKSKNKKKSKQRLTTKLEINIPDYEIEVFSALVSFLHCGRVSVNVNTAPGLLCASSEFGQKDLHKACWDYVRRCKGHGQLNALMKSSKIYKNRRLIQNLLSEINSTPV